MNAIIYGFSIIIIYVGLGVGVSSIFGADVLNNMATNIYVNMGFLMLLIMFVASFLGAFDIQLPASWTNKSVEAEGKGGIIGIFFMAFTLALVSFSCTGPIVGTLLVEAATGGYLGPIIGMLGFSLAIALPFALFAAFPGWLNSLPQSGGWLNSVKVTLGFLEIALAFKFLSNADLVLQAHFLERELFIAIWIVIFGLLTMYLLGFIKFAHDSDLKYISVSRLSVAVLTGTLTIYMIPGLWGAPLKIINAFPPPMHYSESPQGIGMSSISKISDVEISKDKKLHLGPQGIMVFHDYDKGIKYAKEVGKPAMLDFTGWACVNCRKMEEQVWSDSNVKQILSNDVVLISLYVDERIDLPLDQQYETKLAGKTKKVKTTGDKWMVLQANSFGTNSQPYYVILDNNENQINEAANYQDYGSVAKFEDWLNRGLAEYKKLNIK
jgi:thiol:disulfide interchange protein DsbD